MKNPDLIPPHTLAALQAYINEGIPTGDFLFCVLTNDLCGAVAHADSLNAPALSDIVAYCWKELPSTAWGSRERVHAWLKQKHNERTHERHKA